MDRKTVLECYMMNDKHVIAEMLYDTITKYESQKCSRCKYGNESDGRYWCNVGTSSIKDNPPDYSCSAFSIAPHLK